MLTEVITASQFFNESNRYILKTEFDPNFYQISERQQKDKMHIKDY